MRHIAVRRIYEQASEEDGFRVLVDRIWPRGISKEAAAIDHWAKDLAPSAPLRKWFNHDPARWEEFQRRYGAELQDNSGALQELLERCGSRSMTLLFAAKDSKCNQAVVLKNALDRM